jgi:hypothetical protein
MAEFTEEQLTAIAAEVKRQTSLTTDVREAQRARNIQKMGSGETTHKKTPVYSLLDCIELELVRERWNPMMDDDDSTVITTMQHYVLPILIPEFSHLDWDQIAPEEKLQLLMESPKWEDHKKKLEKVFGGCEYWNI